MSRYNRSPREIEHELDDLEGGTSTEETGGEWAVARERLKVAYRDEYGIETSFDDDEPYNQALAWIRGQRDIDDPPPMPTEAIRQALIDTLDAPDIDEWYHTTVKLAEVFGLPEPPDNADRERMIDDVREAGR